VWVVSRWWLAVRIQHGADYVVDMFTRWMLHISAWMVFHWWASVRRWAGVLRLKLRRRLGLRLQRVAWGAWILRRCGRYIRYGRGSVDSRWSGIWMFRPLRALGVRRRMYYGRRGLLGVVLMRRWGRREGVDTRQTVRPRWGIDLLVRGRDRVIGWERGPVIVLVRAG
jgi:hypothetical protein